MKPAPTTAASVLTKKKPSALFKELKGGRRERQGGKANVYVVGSTGFEVVFRPFAGLLEICVAELWLYLQVVLCSLFRGGFCRAQKLKFKTFGGQLLTSHASWLLLTLISFDSAPYPKKPLSTKLNRSRCCRGFTCFRVKGSAG